MSEKSILERPIQLTGMLLFLLSTFVVLTATGNAQELTILYTGQTHAMLYPCNCPVEPYGGVLRRATVLQQSRSKGDVLVVDSGNFFAGGLLDQNSQNSQLDMQRTRLNVTAMEAMKYDAVNIGDDEFNYGRDFFQQIASGTSLSFVSCNIASQTASHTLERIHPYIIKELHQVRIGIIGAANPSLSRKDAGLTIAVPSEAVKKAIEELKQNNVDIILLLSNLDEPLETNLIKNTPGIDIVVSGYSPQKAESPVKIGDTIVVKPAWQGRAVGQLRLTIENKKIKDYKSEELPLSGKIADDKEIAALLPRCFSDDNCRKDGAAGKCRNPGGDNSSCEFSALPKIKADVIVPKNSMVSNHEEIVKRLQRLFPSLVVSYHPYPGSEADKLIKDLKIDGLPAYILSKEIEKQDSFNSFKDSLESRGNFYLVKPSVSGVELYNTRKTIKNRVDLFVSLFDKDMPRLLENIREFNPNIHFLAAPEKDGFTAARGNGEVEEYLRCVCVQKYYPALFWNYMTCRAQHIDSSWWEDCLSAADADIVKIKSCSRGEEGAALLRDNTSMNKEFHVMKGPAYLLENQEIFASQEVPSKEDFKHILKR